MFRNIDACQQLSKMTRSALGPHGMNKMVINHLDKLFVTSDAATIIKESDIHHPAAKMIAMAAKMQETECGDGSNFVISLGGELMNQAQNLLTMGLHPSEILIGYEKAAKKWHEEFDKVSVYTVKDIFDEEEVVKCIKASVASKQYGLEDLLSNLIAKACIYAISKKTKKLNVDNIRVQKILGGGITDSEVVRGMVVIRQSETSVHRVANAKVAVFNANFEMQQGETKGTVLFENADQLENYAKSEEAKFEEVIKGLAEAGVSCVVCSGSMSEMAVHFFEKYKIMAIKIMSKWEVKRIARAVGATPIVKLGTPSPDEIGFADEVTFKEISSQKCIVFRRDQEENKMATIVLRGATTSMLDDVERAIDDGVNTIKTLCRDGRMVAGAGATEIHFAKIIQDFAKTQPGLDQYAIEKFGQALEVIPRTIADNAGLKAEEIIADLYSKTAESGNFGIDVSDGKVKDVTEMGIFDSWETKSWAFKLCVDAVLTILKVDQIIMSKPSGGPNQSRAAKAPEGYHD
jgi:T-complex protein 1 subunit theta